MDLRAVRERRLDLVVGSGGARRANVERWHERPLSTVVGEVRVSRIAYRARGQENLYVADGALNLPEEKPSHGIRRLAAIEAPRGRFEDAQEAIVRHTGQRLGKRQLRELVVRSAQDFESFYAQRQQVAPEEKDMLVLSCDAKGVVMRPEALREQTKKQAQDAKQKLQTRLSKGEKRGRKRMAEVVAVYEVTPVARTAADILPAGDEQRAAARKAPEAKKKWLAASVSDDAAGPQPLARAFGQPQPVTEPFNDLTVAAEIDAREPGDLGHRADERTHTWGRRRRRITSRQRYGTISDGRPASINVYATLCARSSPKTRAVTGASTVQPTECSNLR